MSISDMAVKDFEDSLGDISSRIGERVRDTGLELVEALLLEGVPTILANKWASDIDKPKYAELKEAYVCGLLELEARATQNILKMGKPNELLNYLERKFPDKYSKKAETEERPNVINIVLPAKLDELAR